MGFDNQLIVAEALMPQLTTVALPHYEMGAMAVGILIEAIESNTQPPPTALVLPNSLVRRASVAPPSGGRIAG